MDGFFFKQCKRVAYHFIKKGETKGEQGNGRAKVQNTTTTCPPSTILKG